MMCNAAAHFLDELRGAMSDKSWALRAKSDDVNSLKMSSPRGHRQHGRACVVARRSQSYGYASSSRLADHTRGVDDGITYHGITGH
jgi:hypothetical protein